MFLSLTILSFLGVFHVFVLFCPRLSFPASSSTFHLFFYPKHSALLCPVLSFYVCIFSVLHSCLLHFCECAAVLGYSPCIMSLSLLPPADHHKYRVTERKLYGVEGSSTFLECIPKSLQARVTWTFQKHPQNPREEVRWMVDVKATTKRSDKDTVRKSNSFPVHFSYTGKLKKDFIEVLLFSPQCCC